MDPFGKKTEHTFDTRRWGGCVWRAVPRLAWCWSVSAEPWHRMCVVQSSVACALWCSRIHHWAWWLAGGGCCHLGLLNSPQTHALARAVSVRVAAGGANMPVEHLLQGALPLQLLALADTPAFLSNLPFACSLDGTPEMRGYWVRSGITLACNPHFWGRINFQQELGW